MSTRDRYDEYPDGIPRLTLAEPMSRTNTSRDDRQEAAQVPTQPLGMRPEPNIAGSEGSAIEPNSESDFDAGGAPTRRTAELDHTAETSTETILFAEDELTGLRARWNAVQAGFVDDPRNCVQKADGLVSDVVGQLTHGFTEARSRLEQQWGRGEEVSTEDLRIALTRYRDFFERLLAV
jgi:hypothetical protein